MIYLDYSATTPVNKDVLESFNYITNNFIGNANSLHKLGIKNNQLIMASTKQIKDILHLNDEEIIYTSNVSEANNLALKGICLKYQNRGKHIITTKYEHSSVIETLKYLEEKYGFEISYVKSDKNGVVDINDLENIMTDNTILVSICAVNSEIGILNPIEKIGEILKKYPKCFFHSDLTQSLGKININMENIDLISISSHKIYGLPGIAALIKKKNILLEPLIHGGKSTTIYRSGTPNHALIASFAKAIRLSCEKIESKYEYVKSLNEDLQKELKKLPYIKINSNSSCIPYILNISIIGIKSETIIHALEEDDIYISASTACNSDDYSTNVLELTNDMERAKSSLRISLSHLTTKTEIEIFLKSLQKHCEKLLLTK